MESEVGVTSWTPRNLCGTTTSGSAETTTSGRMDLTEKVPYEAQYDL